MRPPLPSELQDVTCCLTRRGDRYKWAFNLAKVGPQPGEAVLPIASAPESSDFLFREVKRKARERLEAASDRLARELLKMATDPNVSESVRLSATKDALDRGGVSAKTAVEVEVGPPKPYEQILDSLAVVESGSRAEFRRSRESPATKTRQWSGRATIRDRHPNRRGCGHSAHCRQAGLTDDLMTDTCLWLAGVRMD